MTVPGQMKDNDWEICKCGKYRFVHPTDNCKAFREPKKAKVKNDKPRINRKGKKPTQRRK